MSVVGSISIKDNVTATLRNIRREQAAFRSDVVKTKSELKAAWDKTYTAKVNTTSSVQKTDRLLSKVKLLGREVISPVIRAKDEASAKINKVRSAIKTVGNKVISPVVRVKDEATAKITKVGNAIKSVGKKIASPVIKAKDTASKVLQTIGSKMKSVGSMIAKPVVALKDGATAGLSSIKNMMGTLAKGVTIAVGAAGVGLTAVVGGSLRSGADMEQNIGGVETLFKDSSDVVKANADKAFKTAGLSANSYMETVTGFSASLLQSLGGDTAKAADMADMAIIDMADNANKMGTSMESIQNAYSGFAKQNYTMLDNLKLGYGGTKEEMQRLLSEAQKISGVNYDISNLADVYNAIHVIQENLDITGTTAKEASETFSGSFASMKSAVNNLLGNMAIGGDITKSMEQVIETASTFLFDNALPMIGNVFSALPDVMKTAVKTMGPKVKKIGGEIAGNIRDGLNEMFPTSMGGLGDMFYNSVSGAVSAISPVVGQLQEMFAEVAPVIADALGNAFGDGGGTLQSFADLASSVIPTVGNIIKELAVAFSYITPVVLSLGQMFADIFPSILSVVEAAMPAVTQILKSFANIVQMVFPVVSNVITMVLNAVMPVVNAFAGLLQSALPIVENIIQVFSNVVAEVFPVVQTIFQGLGEKIAQVVGVVTKHMGLIQGVVETVSPIIQSAVQIVSNVLSTAWDIISPIMDLAISVFDALLSCVETVFPSIQTAITTVWGVLEPIFESIANGFHVVGDAISGAAEFIGKGVNAVTGWFNSASDVKGTSGKGRSIGSGIGKNADGDNNWKGGLTWVGEKGAELVDLPKGSRILPHKESVSFASARPNADAAVRGTVTNVLQNVIPGTRDGGNESSEPLYNIMDILKEVLEILKDRWDKQEKDPEASNKPKPSGGAAQVIIQKLADQIIVREDEDIDAVADRVAKKFLEVVLNMG